MNQIKGYRAAALKLKAIAIISTRGPLRKEVKSEFLNLQFQEYKVREVVKTNFEIIEFSHLLHALFTHVSFPSVIEKKC